MRLILLLLSQLFAFGCVSSLPPNISSTQDFIPIFPETSGNPRKATGSIFMDQSSSRTFGHKRKFEAGDILTVILTESTKAQRRSGLEAVKEGNNVPLRGLQALITKPLNTPVNGSSWMKNQSMDAFKATDFDDLTVQTKGRGSANQAASLDGSIAVLVTQVLPNDNLVIQGKKRLSLSEGSETVELSGVVSSRDVQPDNTVLSSRIAGAQIAYRGSGELAEFAKVNWGTRVFNKVWPF